MKTYSAEVQTICRGIGEFYRQRGEDIHYGCDYYQCEEMIRAAGIVDVEFVDEQILIHSSRPAVIIGKHGVVINALIEHLTGTLPFFVNGVQVVEAHDINDLIIPPI
jgi:hypothetical protein